MTATPHLSVVIPAFREELRLEQSLPRVRSYLEKQPFDWEIVVVDDGSPDRTSEVARRLLQGTSHQVLRNEPNAGKGASIRRGMLASQGAHALFSDADLSTPIEDLDLLWPEVLNGADVVIGSRALKTSNLIVRQPFFRELSGRAFNTVVRLLAVPGIRDTQCGFKLFSRRAVDLLFPLQSMAGFAFDVELLALSHAAGMTIREVGVRWENSPDSRVALPAALRAFADVFRVRRRVRQAMRDGRLSAAAEKANP